MGRIGIINDGGSGMVVGEGVEQQYIIRLRRISVNILFLSEKRFVFVIYVLLLHK